MSIDRPTSNLDEALREQMRAAGLRATKSRVAVLRVLQAEGVPRTHGEVTEALKGEAWDRATLYRNLTDLTDAGILRRLDLGDRVWRYEMARGGHTVDSRTHPHFLCTSCGDIQCLPGAEMSVGGDAPHSLRTGAVAIQVRGLCDTCEQV